MADLKDATQSMETIAGFEAQAALGIRQNHHGEWAPVVIALCKDIRFYRTELAEATRLLRALIEHVEGETCTHEGTHRGGIIWEICDDCGAKWADDQGGKPKFRWPHSVTKARAFLSRQEKPNE